MKLKLAVIAMIASMTLSCDTSYGCDLLNRMLGRAGCSSCEAPKAPSCGCGGGLMDKLIGKSAGGGCCGSDMLTYDANASCGPVASDCGCGAAPAPVADCGCGSPAPAVADCGCSAAPVEAAPVVADCGCGAPVAAAPVVADCGCGSPAPVSDCGCSAAPVEAAPVVADCGCSAAPVEAAPVVADCGCGAPAAPATGGGLSLFSGLRGNQGGCGCDAAPAPAPVADCGCGAPVVGGGLGVAKKPFSGLRSMFRKTSHGACGFAPIAAAPVADCGCGSPAPAPVADCGCGSPAPVSDCGCGGSAVTPCGFTGGGGSRGPLTLMDRLRGNRIPRTREGVVIGTEGSNGCNPPCPQAPAAAAGCGCGGPVHQEGAVYEEAAPCTSCGGGEVVYGEAQPTSGCTTCGTGEGEIIYGDPLSVPATPAITSEGTSASPVLPPAGGSSTKSEAIQNATEGVIEAGGGASEASPVVDPGAFVPRKGRTTVGG